LKSTASLRSPIYSMGLSSCIAFWSHLCMTSRR
jgi:hypothetical protein